MFTKKIQPFTSPLFTGEHPAEFLFVQGVGEIYGDKCKLYYILLTADGQQVHDGNKEMADEAYELWDGNDNNYPYEFVAQQLGLTIIE